MTKKQMISSIASSTSLSSSDVSKVLSALSDICESELKSSGTFVLNDMVRIKVVNRPAQPERQMRSPATGQMVTVAAKPASKKLRVSAAKHLRELVKA